MAILSLPLETSRSEDEIAIVADEIANDEITVAWQVGMRHHLRGYLCLSIIDPVGVYPNQQNVAPSQISIFIQSKETKRSNLHHGTVTWIIRHTSLSLILLSVPFR
jgi:hypothetical protein